ncbi:hypothetical protein [Bacillus gaemokensis]|uniref:Phosphoesterase n=1 Tax=Bacillus gaemokensis TaxID=574375 RepID=A0A073KFS8_9BACI|nr:hypothetical protein [Bacillus gaemokensis]KEK21168.1 phosphoesterase [Bacillus gaemokensis]
MNIIDFELVRKRKIKENKMITIPIIERVFEVNGEILFEVTGEKEIPIAWLEKE